MESKTTSSDNISTDIPLVRDASSPSSAASSQPPPYTPKDPSENSRKRIPSVAVTASSGIPSIHASAPSAPHIQEPIPSPGTKLEDKVSIHPEEPPPSYDSICTKQPKSSDAKAFEPTAPPDLRQAAHIDGLGCSNMNQSVPPATTGRNDKDYWCDCDCDGDSLLCCLEGCRCLLGCVYLVALCAGSR
ncbi:hypothetical protein NQ317_010504 [Molorchus minor]|uniref:Uncharacterized protein n=1 Tax=Molorchus minor TaxID=1323400 RepID=A0ABQ9ITE4_9CUCU|nr:hypothetical protein NQ317_010504 [Molorchus minor]